MADFIEAIESRMQRTGEYWQQADKTLAVMTDPEIVVSSDEESRYITTAPIKIKQSSHEQEGLSEKEKRVYANTFALAARTNTGQYSSDLPLYLIINGNYTNPVLKLERQVDTLTLMDDNFTDLEDAQNYVPAILAAINNNVESSERRKELHQREQKRHRRNKWIGTAVVLGLLGGAAAVGNHFWQEKVATDERIQQEREAFDTQDIDIESRAVSAGDLGYIENGLAFFGQDIPEPAENESYEHPRLINMPNQSCFSITTLHAGEQSVKAVTDATAERLFTAVNSAGVVQVCYFGTAPTSGVGPRVAVQIVGAQ